MRKNVKTEPSVEVLEVEEVVVSAPEADFSDSEFQSEETKMRTDKKFLTVKTASIIAGVLIIVALGFYVRGLSVAATVNGETISRLAVIQKLEKASGKDALDSLITEKLVTDEVKKKGITVSPDEVTKEVQTIEDGLKAQGTTLDQALAAQKMTRDDLTQQLTIKKQLEKLLADKMTVTDQEIAQYIKDNKITIPKGQEAQYNDQVKTQLSQQKFGTAVQDLIDSLKKGANIKYIVNYQ